MAAASSPTNGYRAQIAEALADGVSGELMTRAVTLLPCGHAFNEDTIIAILGRDSLCPNDRRVIERHIPNYTIRNLAEITRTHPDAKTTDVQTVVPSSALEQTSLPQLPIPPAPPFAFGALKWAQHLGIQVVETPLPPDIEQILAGPCPFFPGKKVMETHLLTLIPEGMTPQRVGILVKNPSQCNGFRYEEKDWGYHNKTPAVKTYWALITNDVIPNSRNTSWQAQQALASQYRSQGYELPSLIDVVASLLLEYAQAGRRFCSDSPSTYALCVEPPVAGASQQPIAVGSFTSEGLDVCDYCGVRESDGICLVKKF